MIVLVKAFVIGNLENVGAFMDLVVCAIYICGNLAIAFMAIGSI